MSNETPDLNTLGMPVGEVVAYLSEIAAHNSMIASRITDQISSLKDAMDAAAEAQTLADSSTQDVD
tara:strand:- start:3629 stop:3826 length:198 start_codon:yes stop_codon:yes gene_type:complete